MGIDDLQQVAELNEEVKELKRAKVFLNEKLGHVAVGKFFGNSDRFDCAILRDGRFKIAIDIEIDNRLSEIEQIIKNM